MTNVLNSLMSGGYDPYDDVAVCEEHDSDDTYEEEEGVIPSYPTYDPPCNPAGFVELDELPF